jgi:LacI family transcriptional regulator
VALQAQVSEAAVTHVLNGSTGTIRVSPATRDRIFSVASRLGYTPHPHAVALRRGRTRTIAFIVPEPTLYLSHPNGILVLNQLIEAAREMRYRLLIHADLNEMPDVRLIDGCLVLGCPEESAARMTELAARTPLLTLGRDLHLRIPGAVRGELEGGSWATAWRTAARYLCGLGHRRIALVDATEESHPRNGFAAFREEAERLHAPVRLEYFVNDWRRRRYPTVESLCRLDPMPTAACVFDDDYARVLIARLAVAGRRVPADLSIFSCQTHAQTGDMLPQLAGIDRHAEAAYARMLRDFIRLIESGAHVEEVRVRIAEPELIVRESCAPPGSGAVGGTPGVDARRGERQGSCSFSTGGGI